MWPINRIKHGKSLTKWGEESSPGSFFLQPKLNIFPDQQSKVS